jgi:hypothetical protein
LYLYALEIDFPPSVKIKNRINRAYLKTNLEPMTNPKFKKRIRNFLFDNFTESKMTSAAERSEKLASARRKLLEYQQKHNHISSPPGLQPAVRLPLPATGAQQTPLIPAPSSSSLASSTSLLPTSTQFDYLKVSAISRPNSINSPRMSDQQVSETPLNITF